MKNPLKLIRFPTSSFQPFHETLELQERLVRQKLNNRRNEPDYLIAVQHSPVITLGRRSHSDIIAEEKNIPIIKVKILFYSVVLSNYHLSLICML